MGHLGLVPAPSQGSVRLLLSVGSDPQHSWMRIIDIRFITGSSVGGKPHIPGPYSTAVSSAWYAPPPRQRAWAMERRGEVGKALLIQSVRSRRESQSLQLIQAGPSEMLVSELALFPTETWGGGGTWEATLSSNSLE